MMGDQWKHAQLVAALLAVTCGHCRIVVSSSIDNIVCTIIRIASGYRCGNYQNGILQIT
jgi:hypothetical protein